MIATIICGAVLLVLITLALINTIEDGFWSDFFGGIGALILCVGLVLGFFLYLGYSKPYHEYTKEQIIQVLETTPSVGVKLAKDWNRMEHQDNNYFFRFTLREEDLIDIDYYLKGENE